MNIDDIFNQRKKRWNKLIKVRKSDSVQVECPKCKAELTADQIRSNMYICPECGHYYPVKPTERIAMISDEDTFKEMYAGLKTTDPLDFPEYSEKLEANRAKTGQLDAAVTGTCKINGIRCAVAVLDGRFLMGSMGTVVGEKIVRLTEYADKKHLPLIIFSASGGARMQEGLFSLMQMARTSAAIQRYKDNGGLYISVLTNPTTGGVSASFASLGDIIMAEPKALICFAGPRVIEQTIGQKLPEGFQRAEFLLEHGMLDMITERAHLRETLSKIIAIHA
ncbi:MAG: acetyl-CoA carboxylase, carboxyltransferase subunit beta [Lachnospira sp.]